MQIRTQCPTCRNIYELDAKYEGTEVECQGCHTTFTVTRLRPTISNELSQMLDEPSKKPIKTWNSSDWLVVTTLIRICIYLIIALCMFGAKNNPGWLREGGLTALYFLCFFAVVVHIAWLWAFAIFLKSHKRAVESTSEHKGSAK